MLKEGLKNISRVPVTESEPLSAAKSVLMDEIALLADPDFPQPAISSAVAQMEGALDRQVNIVFPDTQIEIAQVLVANMPGRHLQAPVFIVAAELGQLAAFLVLPKDYPTRVSRSPFWQLGIVAYLASQTKDYLAGKIVGQSRASNTRARAYQAEALLSLQKIAQRENLRFYLPRMTPDVLLEFPRGLANLPRELAY